MTHLQGREILLGVSGGIACYKGVEVLRGLKRAGAGVSVVMTAHATEFVQPLTFQTLSNRPVGTRQFDLDQESRIGHIRLAEQAELALVAPCTANVVAKLRAGLADDLLSTVLLATTAPIYLALAMNDNMLANPAMEENLEVLRQRGVHIIPPETGFLAEGREAPGRLADPDRIVAAVARHFADSAPGGTLTGRKVLVTAGPTVERIDPVRFITNRSSGRMGYAVAEACRDAGADVLLVSGPTALPKPTGIALSQVTSTEEMRAAVLEHQPAQDALVFAAAVSDYRVRNPAEHKIKRAGRPNLTLELEANPDIAAQAGERKRPGQVLVVFAAESQNLLENAEKKLRSKNADLVVANDITEPGSGFESPNNRVTLLRRGADGAAAPPPESLPLMEKSRVALRIAAVVAELLALAG
ncbi:MAG: bifunctional phosphopantothenoylcysteine decarboxylase/phosphopantothenate--cysteine ligase CoaBC [SAR324 cluster bacterium]|nr:bifunctional phosphopantothenoylcysteine decarboxylase/phosphopantothenate--cysteine ligase CoaBC [SAR324 cluster bacterium]